MLKRIMTIFTTIGLMVALGTGVAHADSNDNVIDEFAGKPIIVYGGTLDEGQREEVKRLLNSKDQDVDELDVTGYDLTNYIGGNPNANMYSSVKIEFK